MYMLAYAINLHAFDPSFVQRAVYRSIELLHAKRVVSINDFLMIFFEGNENV